MILSFDMPKICWGYYQDYLGQVFGSKIPQKNSIDFQQNPKIIVLRKKMAETEVAAEFQIWSKNSMGASSRICWCQYGQLLWPNLPVDSG